MTDSKYIKSIKKLQSEWVPQIYMISDRVLLVEYLSKIDGPMLVIPVSSS